MSAPTCVKKIVALLCVAASLFVAGCSQQSQPDKPATQAPTVEQFSHPDRNPTMSDVQAGTACVQAPVTVIVWIEDNRTYKEGSYCKFKATQ
jgi:hypothetical protein